jgi:hypothetical protein
MSQRATPGIYEEILAATPPSAVVRDDVAAFVGLTERGPVDRAVRLERWEDFRSLFGGRSDAFALPDAVESFFANGGRVCYVVRVLHRKVRVAGEEVGLPAAGTCNALTTRLDDGTVVKPRWVAAQFGLEDPGSWANGVGCAVRFLTRALGVPMQPDGAGSVVFGEDTPRTGLGPGTLLRVVQGGAEHFRVVTGTALVPSTSGGLAVPVLRVEWESPLVLVAGAQVSLVEATVEVRGWNGQGERFDGLGLDPRHERYLPRVVAAGSRLVMMQVAGALPLGTLLPVSVVPKEGQPAPGDEAAISTLSEGKDGLTDFTREDFFPGADLDIERPETLIGLGQLHRLRDVSLVVLPDLVLPGKQEAAPPGPPPAPPRSRKRVRFVCGSPPLAPTQPSPEPPPRFVTPEALIDPAVALVPVGKTRADLWKDLASAEARLVAYCEASGDRVALLAPPPSADPRRVAVWRRGFESAFAAAYYPWLLFGDSVVTPAVRLVPPTGVAAGIIARAEARFGVGRSPANLTALSVIGPAQPVTTEEWGALHEESLNLFRPGISEVRLLGGRTLSTQGEWRYLHVRRLITHLERVVERRMGWVVFEPNTPALWSRIRHDLDAHVLRPLFQRGAFAGDTAEQSYFIRCDEKINTRAQLEQGRVWCEIGVAPSVPAEYIVFRLSASRETGILVQEVL